MALWGSQDLKSQTGSGTFTVASGAVSFSVGQTLRVGDVIRATASGEEYVIVTVPTTQPATSGYVARPGVQGATMTDRSAITSANWTISEKPVFVSAAESGTSSGDSGDSAKVYGVDTAEITVANASGSSRAGVQHAGWVRRVAGSGGRNGRIQYETLVASGSITGDQGDDTQFPDT